MRETQFSGRGICPRRFRAGRRFLVAFGIILLGVSTSWAEKAEPTKPGPKDKCPVCGMFVAKYPDFVAEIIFRDGHRVYFDGVKDMMKYYLDLKKYDPSRKQEDIESVYVTDYYRLEFIEGLKAFYVMGSDVHGPMGKELIPFEKKSEADEFVKDHNGKSPTTFGNIDMRTVQGLDR